MRERNLSHAFFFTLSQPESTFPNNTLHQAFRSDTFSGRRTFQRSNLPLFRSPCSTEATEKRCIRFLLFLTLIITGS